MTEITCKQVLKEIAISGTDVSAEAETHRARCATCTAAFNKAAELERCLLAVPQLEAPAALKYAVLEAAGNKKPVRFFLHLPASLLGTLLQTAAVLILLTAMFWLGMQTAEPGNKTDDFNITEADVYRANVESVPNENLGEIYFSLLLETIDGK
jgi:hypothetical protein